jgi:hypothetical protein
MAAALAVIIDSHRCCFLSPERFARLPLVPRLAFRGITRQGIILFIVMMVWTTVVRSHETHEIIASPQS